jgi:hypothetical protein
MIIGKKNLSRLDHQSVQLTGLGCKPWGLIGEKS